MFVVQKGRDGFPGLKESGVGSIAVRTLRACLYDFQKGFLNGFGRRNVRIAEAEIENVLFTMYLL